MDRFHLLRALLFFLFNGAESIPLSQTVLSGLPPANYSGYSGVVIPSYIDHIGFLTRQLTSYEFMCVDCHQTPTLVVVSSTAEVALFQSKLPPLSNVSVWVVSVHEVVRFSRPNTTVAFLDTLTNFKRNGKHLMQSIKKLYGCLSLRTIWCFATDSESFLVKLTSFNDMAQQYAEKKVIVHNSQYFGRGYHKTVLSSTLEALGAQCNQSMADLGYSNEVYSWLWERETLLNFIKHNVKFGKDVLGMAHDQVVYRSRESHFFFVEEAINQFRACTDRNSYTWVDVSVMLETAILNARGTMNPQLRDQALQMTGDFPFLETSGKQITRLEDLIPNYATQMGSVFRKLRLPTYSASISKRFDQKAFDLNSVLINTSGVHVCTSWCSDEFFGCFVKGVCPPTPPADAGFTRIRPIVTGTVDINGGTKKQGHKGRERSRQQEKAKLIRLPPNAHEHEFTHVTEVSFTSP